MCSNSNESGNLPLYPTNEKIGVNIDSLPKLHQKMIVIIFYYSLVLKTVLTESMAEELYVSMDDETYQEAKIVIDAMSKEERLKRLDEFYQVSYYVQHKESITIN